MCLCDLIGLQARQRPGGQPSPPPPPQRFPPTSLCKVLQRLQSRRDVVATGCWPLIIKLARGAQKEACGCGMREAPALLQGGRNRLPFIQSTRDEDDPLLNSSTYTNLEFEKGAEKLTGGAEAWPRLAESPFKAQSCARAQSGRCQRRRLPLPPSSDASVSAPPVIPIIPNRLASATEGKPTAWPSPQLSLPEAPLIANTWRQVAGRITGLVCGPQRRCARQRGTGRCCSHFYSPRCQKGGGGQLSVNPNSRSPQQRTQWLPA